MTLKEVLEKCPNAKQRYYAFVEKGLLGFQSMMTREISEKTEMDVPSIESDIVKGFAENTLIANPRVLYDFFDSEKIIVWPVFVYHNIDNLNDGGYWGFEIRTPAIIGDENEEYKSRAEAEMVGFTEAFLLLEQKLNNE